jgi:glycosyltransferase involved in cell wall biosynthesis
MNNNRERALLSICIPTYNRAELLKETLHSIVSQPLFIETGYVEIVISDNCSSDHTEQVSLGFVGSFPHKIKYFKNTENVKDLNFELALSRAEGIFLKLNNDTLVHLPGSLHSMIATIRENLTSKNIVFFLNKNFPIGDNVYCNSMDDLVKNVSFFTTWIGGFGIWKEDFDKIQDFSRYKDLQLVQTDVLLRLMDHDRSAQINNTRLFTFIDVVKKGGYNFYNVFITNYINILKPYFDNKSISKKTYIGEKKKLFRNFIYPWSKNIFLSDKFSFDKKDALSITFREYKLFPFFYVALAYLLAVLLKKRIFG